MGRGSVRMSWNGDEVLDCVQRGTIRGLRNGADHLLTESNRDVPLREGILQDSGRAEVDETALTASVSYDTPYAEVQHEREDFNHPNGRKDHYLSDVIEREDPVVFGLLAAAIQAEVGKRGTTPRRRRS